MWRVADERQIIPTEDEILQSEEWFLKKEKV